MKKTTKKLAFSTETVRQLQNTMTEEELQGVAGGTALPNLPNLPGNIASPGLPKKPPVGPPVSGSILAC